MIKNSMIAWLVGISICHAGTTDPSVADQRYLEYGDSHACVVPIHGDCNCGEHDNKPHELSASAVVINRRWVITAAHVVNKATNVRIYIKDKNHSMKNVIVHENFKKEEMGKFDIAICESESDMELDFYPELYEGNREVGSVASICGYGSTGTFSTGAYRSDGRKRAGSNVVDRVENQVLVCSAEGSRKTSMEFLIASGDSGGGMFINGKLAGINSFVTAADGTTNSDYGDECCHTRISIFAKWIKDHIDDE